MTCQICGRGACTRSFHSFEDQDKFDEARERTDCDEEARELVDTEENENHE